MYIVYSVSLFVGLAFIVFGLLVFLAFLIVASDSKELKYIGDSAIGGIIILLGLWGVSISYKYIHSPKVIKDNTDKEYQKLLTDIDEANKKLQKFYIDHPEYKLEEKEND